MKFTSHIIFITCNYDCYIIYGKCKEPNKRRLDLHITEWDSCVGQIIKGQCYWRDKKHIEHNTGDLNALILHFRAGALSDSE